MTPCFCCVYCYHSPDRGRLWCHRHNKDAIRRCSDYLREVGVDD